MTADVLAMYACEQRKLVWRDAAGAWWSINEEKAHPRDPPSSATGFPGMSFIKKYRFWIFKDQWWSLLLLPKFCGISGSACIFVHIIHVINIGLYHVCLSFMRLTNGTETCSASKIFTFELRTMYQTYE